MLRRLSGLLLLLLVPLSASASGIEGDARALKRVEQMLAALGGRSLWAEARSLHTIERARHPDYGDGIEANMWHNLEAPGEYAHLIHSQVEIKRGWDEDGGWVKKDDDLRDYSEEEVQKRIFYWHRDMYTLYHQLAKGERKLTVRALEPDGILVLDENGEDVAKFKLSPDGQVYYWELLGGKGERVFIYGPHRNFGEVRFPDWGTSTDGSWSSYYLQVRPSRRSFAANVNLAKPDERFSGGALVKEKCRE